MRGGGASDAEAAKLQVFLDGHGAEQFAMFRNDAQARRDAVLDLEPGNLLIRERDAAGERQNAHDGVEQRGLARAVGTDDGDNLVGIDVERRAAHGLDLAVEDVRIFDRQQSGHDAVPR